MSLWDYTLLCAVIGAATSGGVFVAFSTFIMSALRRLDPAEGIRAMQHINRTVITPGFMVPWLGTGVLSLALAWYAYTLRGTEDAWTLALGVLAYLVFNIGSTIAFNVPLNDRLEEVDAADPEAHALWADYLVRWTRWNHLRALACLVAAVCFVLVLR